MFDPITYVERVVSDVRRCCSGAKRVLAAVSGGVDSVTSAVLVKRALGEALTAVYIDTGFMRLKEAEFVKRSLQGLLDLDVIDRAERFYCALLNLDDAEEKRKAFRDTFYKVLAELIKEYKCEYIVQGTIKADVVETVGGVKTQHNVLNKELQERYGVKVIEPLRDLYKHEVREVARYLGIPEFIANRQPFPGPGLLVRTVGRFTLEKLEIVQKATEVVEKNLESFGASQYFAAAWEHDLGPTTEVCLGPSKCLKLQRFKVQATGVREGKRVYSNIGLLRGDQELREEEVAELADITGVSRFILLVNERDRGKFFVAVRAVSTQDFMTASVVMPSEGTLRKMVSQLLEIDGVKAVGFDITPKPPATIEYE